jgi:hypothetical protein
MGVRLITYTPSDAATAAALLRFDAYDPRELLVAA